MKIASIIVENYKGLKRTESPMSDFVCVIGENNAGKSSLLQALLLFINGPKLSKTKFYDPDEDILITVVLDGISEDTLSLIAEDHRSKIEKFIEDKKLKLARRYSSSDGSSKLKLIAKVPKDKKYHIDHMNDLFKGKKGNENAETLKAFYPEVAKSNPTANPETQKAAKELIAEYVDKLSSEKLEESDVPLPTGIDNSIRSIFPEPIYIPAVKDLSDDLKTKESASFGKLLNILLDVIEDDLTDATETFENLKKKLNRITQEDGTVVDDRMKKVRDIEKTIQDNLQETFRNVSIELEIPPPDIKTVLSNANVVANDGVRGPIEDKGDGFRRAITFSILRSYVQLSQNSKWKRDGSKKYATKEKFLFLFEEPELYLHPRAQNILFDALSLISKNHQVIVTTHSPLFFSADDTKTFIKIAKRNDDSLPKPIGECLPVDLTDIGERDKFQLISFETSNLAFFSKKIVLVEGDSELIVFPHIAKLLNSLWDFQTSSTSLVKINGKGSFSRYRKFFRRFDIDVLLIADLDVIIRDFDKIDPSPDAIKIRSDLIQVIDKIIDDANKLSPPSAKLLKKELQKQRSKFLLDEIRKARQSRDIDAQIKAIEDFFVFERTSPRLEVLKDYSLPNVVKKKRELLSSLRLSGVFVLEKGTIEAYYPDGVTGPDKPSKAQHFCTVINTGDGIKTLCDCIDCEGASMPEIEAIMAKIFKG